MMQNLINNYAIDVNELSDFVNLDNILNFKGGQEKHAPEYGTYAWKINNNNINVLSFDNIINKSVLKSDIEYWYQIKVSQCNLKPHIDTHFRDIAIIFPIIPKTYKISWFDGTNEDSNIIYTHTYNGPAIINSNIPHGTLDKGLERHIFQVSLSFTNYSWKKIIDLYTTGQLFLI